MTDYITKMIYDYVSIYVAAKSARSARSAGSAGSAGSARLAASPTSSIFLPLISDL